ncbi:MAG TPA: bifunctional phosphoribosylaminoimidazolecarboxamide formyltransferase/IMP cyclohydrolase [Candidatus Marinimicrobia bacterium]|nr:bifunctional phosphoribosylaminoimidazolecarboxamide formyltransferase/IMP cyclohydrolase [Candidatus Neomarinimicrobiota bacterium]
MEQLVNTEKTSVKTALISVSNKENIIELGKGLDGLGIGIISTGGTSKALRDVGITVTNVSDYTGFPEIMEGRVKTINPLVEGGILGLRDKHAEDAEAHNIKWIDLVVCNLYPFAETIQKHDVTLDIALEHIDIGGTTMIRSAAKNVGWVGVVVDPADYDSVLNELQEHGGLTFDTRKRLSAKAYGHTTKYDTLIHNYLKSEPLSDDFSLTFEKYYDLRYGENPHQQAAAYKAPIATGSNILNAVIHQGKKLSYNNIMDADGALDCVKEFDEPVCVVVKHTNPCGVATGEDITDCFHRAFNADSLSAFGGIVALNRTCTTDIAEALRKIFIEIVLAPDFEAGALELFAKKENLRVLEIGQLGSREPRLEYKYVDGGLLVQETDVKTIVLDDLTTVTKVKPSDQNMVDMLFGWKVLKHVKSNAILTAKDNTTLGIGPGQVSRVDAVEIAVRKSGDYLDGSILASDAFFPFRDSIDQIAETGIKAVIQPGGSIRDEEVIEACDEHGIAMVFTGARCFKH